MKSNTDKIIEKAVKKLEEKFNVHTKDCSIGSAGGMDWTCCKSNIKSFLRSALTQALSQHDQEIREKIEGMKKSFHDKNCKATIKINNQKNCNCGANGYNQALSDILALLKNKGGEKE